jgi:hypothetical protein
MPDDLLQAQILGGEATCLAMRIENNAFHLSICNRAYLWQLQWGLALAKPGFQLLPNIPQIILDNLFVLD